MADDPALTPRMKAWLNARARFRLTDAQVHMGFEIGLDPKRLRRLVGQDADQPGRIGAEIERRYRQRTGRERPESVRSLETMAGRLEERRASGRTGLAGRPDEAAPATGGRVILLVAPVSLKALVDELRLVGDEFMAFLDRTNGVFFTLPLDAMVVGELTDEGSARHPGFDLDVVLAQEVGNTERYLALPDALELRGHRLLDRFVSRIEDERIHEEFRDALGGAGTFRRFRRLIQRHGLEGRWDAFESEALAGIGRDWLREHSLTWKEDLES